MPDADAPPDSRAQLEPEPPARSWLLRLKRAFGLSHDTLRPQPGERLRLSGRGIRIPLGRTSFVLELGADRIQVDPHGPEEEPPGASPGEVLIRNAAHSDSGIAHFLVLAPGRRLEFDSGVPEHRLLFDQPKEAFRRKLQIHHQGEALLFRDPIAEIGTHLRVVDAAGAAARRRERRSGALERVREVFGGPIQALAAGPALNMLREVNDRLRQDPFRRADADGDPGALLELPDEVTPILVGDLHGQVDNLLTILSSNGFLEGLEAGSAALIILGDAVHSEREDQLESMDGSVLMMDLIHRLKQRFPARVFFIIGNHDSFLPEVMKGRVPQSLIWGDALVRLRGPDFKAEMERFYRLSPLVVLANDFIACHAGPPRGRVSREMLVELRRYPELVRQMTFNRVQTRARPGGYSRADVRRFRRCLGYDERFPFIVGHYPLSEAGTIWLNVERIRNHHIVYSAREDRVGLFTRVRGVLVPQVYRSAPLLDTTSGR